MNDEFKFTRATVIAFWVFMALLVGSLISAHYQSLAGVYFMYAMPLPFVFAAIFEFVAKRRRNRERRRFTRAP